MTDAWCHGGPCGLSFRAAHGHGLLGGYRFPTWRVQRVGEGRWSERWGVLCPGCVARENPHATGPHTRIVEEWEHEYGALCRVVVGPYVQDSHGYYAPRMTYPADDDVRAAVGGVLGDDFGRDTYHWLGVAFDLRAAVSLAMLDAERLALEWSPPIDEEAA